MKISLLLILSLYFKSSYSQVYSEINDFIAKNNSILILVNGNQINHKDFLFIDDALGGHISYSSNNKETIRMFPLETISKKGMIKKNYKLIFSNGDLVEFKKIGIGDELNFDSWLGIIQDESQLNRLRLVKGLNEDEVNRCRRFKKKIDERIAQINTHIKLGRLSKNKYSARREINNFRNEMHDFLLELDQLPEKMKDSWYYKNLEKRIENSVSVLTNMYQNTF